MCRVVAERKSHMESQRLGERSSARRRGRVTEELTVTRTMLGACNSTKNEDRETGNERVAKKCSKVSQQDVTRLNRRSKRCGRKRYVA
jgi:hypothetical protein